MDVRMRIQVGQTVNLHCHTDLLHDVCWIFQRDNITQNIVVYETVRKYEKHVPSSTVHYSNVTKILRIADVQPDDAGNYTCITGMGSDMENRSTTILEVSGFPTTSDIGTWTTALCVPHTEEASSVWRNPAIWATAAAAGVFTILLLLVAGIVWFVRRQTNARHSELDRRPGVVNDEDFVMTDLLQEIEPTQLNQITYVSVDTSDSSHSSDCDVTDRFTLDPVGETCRGERVRSVCVIEDQLYVARFKQTHIEVYDTLTMEQIDKLLVVIYEHAVPTSLAADETERVIYIAYRNEKVLLRHGLSGTNNDGSKWPVDGKPESISVTSDHTILVTFRRERKLAEFQPDGKLIRNIHLESEIVYPRCTISIIKNNYVICYGKLGETRCGVCVVSSDGTIIPRVNTRTTCPCHISLGPDRTVFVCDYNDGNVVLLDKNFQYVASVLDRYSGVNQPFTSCLDSSRQRIYIGEVSSVQGDSRVMSFNIRFRPRVA